MEKRVAVVFDSAGTLLHMYRVAKEMRTGHILEDIQSTLLVAEKANRALVVLRTRFEDLRSCDQDMGLYEFIEKYGIDIAISCSSSPFLLDVVYRVIRQDSVTLKDLNDVLSLVKKRCPNIFYIAAGLIVDSRDDMVPYVLSTGGQMYSRTSEAIVFLREMGVDIYIASGDDARNLKGLASSLGIPMSSVFPVATTHDKECIVNDLKKNYDMVFMVGDGMNDILALRAADVGILTSQQGDMRPPVLVEAADLVISDIFEVVNIVKSLV
ncbi:HAD family hydrolase [Methanolobus sp. WCC5]|uniref:HAD family hydrolase n=1 Tax=Methanolobus sp. WCC5 TaxID=3125785 RepID=UPI0032430294